MNKKKSKKQEYNNFSSIAKEWWKPDGKFKILHKILPIRIDYILNKIEYNKIKRLEILDLGCGGGLTCEPLARLGASVTGVDFVRENIKVAKNHAIQSNLDINYFHKDIDSITLKKKYDLILVLEVLEHLEDWKLLIKKLKKNLKPKGKVIFSTINKTQLAKITSIFIAENILNWVPKNTHDYNKLIKPEDLIKVLKKNNFKINNIEGMNFNPLTQEWNLNKNFYPVNYFCTAELI